MIDGAGEEGLLDTREEELLETNETPKGVHHYKYTIAGNIMEWGIADPFSASEKKTIYIFERK